MDESRLKTLEDKICSQESRLTEMAERVDDQQELLRSLRGDLETLRDALLEPPDEDDQAQLPF